MKITSQQLVQTGLLNQADADKWVDSLNATFEEFEINTPNRVSMFIAQVAHESGFKSLTENLNYSAQRLCQVFPSRFHGGLAQAEACVKGGRESIAEAIYGGRMGNPAGQAHNFIGRGLIQLTGFENYKKFSDAIRDPSVMTNPEQLALPDHASKSAGWFFKTHGLNELSDHQDIIGATKRINGGTNGLDDRTAKYKKCLSVFNG
jgi:putative chitinase